MPWALELCDVIGEDIDGVMLHDAIGKNDAAMAGRLIEGLAPSALVSTNKAGCTPLMVLAMGQCGRADGLRLVRALLDRCAAAGAPTGAALLWYTGTKRFLFPSKNNPTQ